MIGGSVINSTSVFVGTTQADTILGYYVNMMDQITSIKGNAQSVKNRGLTASANTLSSKEPSFRSSFKLTDYQHDGVKTTTTKVTIGYAILVNTSLFNDALKTEANTIATTAKSIDDAVTSIASFDSASISSTKSSLQSARTTMKEQLTDKINSFFNDFVMDGSSAADEQVKKASTGFMVSSIVIMIGLTIIYLIILGFNIKDKCHAMKCISKIIMLLELILAVLILFFGAVLAALSVGISYACVAIDGAITTPDYLTVKMPGLKVPDNLVKIVNSCLYEKGDGNLFTALGLDLSSTNKITNISSGISSYKTLQSNLTKQDKPLIGGYISANITEGRNNDRELAGVPPTEDTVTGMADFNSYQCSSDKMYLKTAPAGYTTSKNTDAVLQDKGTNFAFIRYSGSYRPATPLPAYYDGRYSPGDCAGVSSFGIDSAGANTRLNNILAAQVQIDAKLANLETNYNNGFYTSESDLFTALKASVNDLDTIYSKIQAAIDYVNSMNGQLPQLLDCRVLNKEINMLANIMCYRIGEDIYQSSGIALALGFIIFVYSWIMCCSIRLANPKDKEEEGQGAGALAYREGETPYGQPAYQDGQNKEAYNTYQ